MCLEGKRNSTSLWNFDGTKYVVNLSKDKTWGILNNYSGFYMPIHCLCDRVSILTWFVVNIKDRLLIVKCLL